MLVGALLFGAALTGSEDASAYVHVVQPGETLASIAEGAYGQIQFERVLVAANHLDSRGGSPIVPGMRLEIPAPGHRRVVEGDTWASLATELLGGPHRADVLSAANDSSPWLKPPVGAEIVVPYNLSVITTGTESIVTIAYRFLGDMNKAWVLDHYNGLKGRKLGRGDVLLVPLTDLPLTDAGKRAAARALGAQRAEGAGDTRAAQQRVESELPALIADVKSARYIDAVTRANRFFAMGDLTKQQVATIHRQLLVAYVALDATGLATASCTKWREADPRAQLDPVELSPKIMDACQRDTR